jgi:hypothetical protein
MNSALGLILYAKERLTPTEEDLWDNFEKYLNVRIFDTYRKCSWRWNKRGRIDISSAFYP